MDRDTPWYRRTLIVVAAAALMVTPALAMGAQETSQDTEDVRIVRDQYGVPHVYGETGEDVAYGAGYALAQDRLWQMHLFRLIGEGRLSEFLGPVVLGTDQGIRALTYTEDERWERFQTYPEDIRKQTKAFVDGINAYIQEVEQDPSKLPLEFAEYGLWPIEDWNVTDSVALQDVLILAFGAGGGNEMSHAALLDELIEEHGQKEGLAIFNDTVPTVDNDGPITIPRDYNYEDKPTFARVDEAEARRGLTDDARLGGTGTGITLGDNVASKLDRAPTPPTTQSTAKGALEQLDLVEEPRTHVENMQPVDQARRLLERVFTFGSNAQIYGPETTETGNAMQTAGPQVGYLLPQWLADFGLHAEDGSLDATGMTFAGAGPAVLIGRGTGYAWTTTTGASDLMDTYVEELHPDDPKMYRFDPDGPDGPAEPRWEQMSCRTETYSFRGVPFEQQEICRTRHGPVVSVNEETDTAISLRYGWFDREGQTVEGFFRYNQVENLEDFATFSNFLASNHNMFYVDDQGNYGFWHPGNFPDRADGVDLRLPQDGTGGSEWEGLIEIQQTPHAVNFDREWLGNWNNMPAKDWARERAWDPIDNADDLYRTMDPDQPAVADPFGGLVNPDRKVDYNDLDANLRYGAFKDHGHTHWTPFLPDASQLDNETAREALETVQAYDGFLTDRDGDGEYHAGQTIVDAWADVMEAQGVEDDTDAADESVLWHVLEQDDSFVLEHDWLGDETVDAFTARTFTAAVEDLAERFGNHAPSTWKEPVDMGHYQRLNADLVTDIAQGAAGVDNSGDSGFPGDVRDHIEMDRGTFNHIVAYQTEPTVGPADPQARQAGDEVNYGTLGLAVDKAGSVIPPGQNGYISITGQEGDHYEDQLDLYEQWRYKPMPMTLEEARDLAESETTLER